MRPLTAPQLYLQRKQRLEILAQNLKKKKIHFTEQSLFRYDLFILVNIISKMWEQKWNKKKVKKPGVKNIGKQPEKNTFD